MFDCGKNQRIKLIRENDHNIFSLVAEDNT